MENRFSRLDRMRLESAKGEGQTVEDFIAELATAHASRFVSVQGSPLEPTGNARSSLVQVQGGKDGE